jgi:tetratricopeptide (TPR) repeat protein
MSDQNKHSGSLFRVRYEVWAYLFLILAALTIYGQVTTHSFVNFDDDIYITANRYIRNGLTLDNVIWAFGFTDIAYWHPLTWLSHMVDYQLFGLNAGMHHLINLILHISNSLLLFYVLKRITGDLIKSAFVAALFALHPIQVESVAWAAERKNVLSTLFWMLTLLAYVRYTEKPVFYRYLLVMTVFVFGLMTKPVLVTLPFVFLLLDYWPLRRFHQTQQIENNVGASEKSKKTEDDDFSAMTSGSNKTNFHRFPVRQLFELLREKIPFILLSIIPVYLSMSSLKHHGILISTKILSMKLRLANALVSYISYLKKIIWPHKLSVFYPYPDALPFWLVFGSGVMLLCITLAAVRLSARKPYLIVGWLWYLGILFPAIGLTQAGLWPAMADRWAYVPIIGIFIIIAWGIPDLLLRYPHRKKGFIVITAIILPTLMIASWIQIGYWRNSITLFEHVLKINPNNAVAHVKLGEVYANKGFPHEAIRHYNETLRIDPDNASVHNNLGLIMAEQGMTDKAIDHYYEALRINPGLEGVHLNMGAALMAKGLINKAIGHFNEELKLNPNDAQTHNNLGIALHKLGHTEEAIRHFTLALQNDPDFDQVHVNLGIALIDSGKLDAGAGHFAEALRLNPNNAAAYNNLGAALLMNGKTEQAVNFFQAALKIKANDVDARNNLIRAQAILDKRKETISKN